MFCILIINIVTSNEEAKAKLAESMTEEGGKHLNYVLPGEWYDPELPMNRQKQ